MLPARREKIPAFCAWWIDKGNNCSIFCYKKSPVSYPPVVRRILSLGTTENRFHAKHELGNVSISDYMSLPSCSVQYISSHLWVHQLPKPCATSNQNGIISSLFSLVNVVWRVFIMGFILLCNRAVLTPVTELMRTGVFLYVLPPVHPVLPPLQSLSLSVDLLFLCSWIMCWFSAQLACSTKRGLSGGLTWSSPTHWKHCYILLLLYIV